MHGRMTWENVAVKEMEYYSEQYRVKKSDVLITRQN